MFRGLTYFLEAGRAEGAAKRISLVVLALGTGHLIYNMRVL